MDWAGILAPGKGTDPPGALLQASIDSPRRRAMPALRLPMRHASGLRSFPGSHQIIPMQAFEAIRTGNCADGSVFGVVKSRIRTFTMARGKMRAKTESSSSRSPGTLCALGLQLQPRMRMCR